MSYQAIYDATLNAMSGISVNAQIAFQQMSIDFQGDSEKAFQGIGNAVDEIKSEHMRPSVLHRPKLFLDGNRWCALYGQNLQEGVAGFGSSPENAMRDFDAEFSKRL